MQHFFKKALLCLSLSCALANSATAHVFDGAYQASSVLHHIIAHSQSIKAISYWLMMKRSLPTWEDAPQAVVNFCRARFAAHGLRAEKIAVKVVPFPQQVTLKFSCMAAFSNKALLIAADWAEQFNEALLNSNPDNDAATNARLIKLYGTIIDHEISHLKNNDGDKTIGIAIASGIASDLALSYFAARAGLQAYVEKPTSWKKLALVSYLLAATGAVKSFIAAHISNYFLRRKEHAADEYAYATSQDPEALRIYAKWWGINSTFLLDYLEGKSLIAPTAVPALQPMFSFCKMLLEQEYVQAKTTEPFRDWLINHQAEALEQLAFVQDPTHPSPSSRAKAALTAAEKLDDEITAKNI